MTRSSAEIPEPTADYYDADGFVWRNVPDSEVQEGWTMMTPEQSAAVQPLTNFDIRRFEANEARSKE